MSCERLETAIPQHVALRVLRCFQWNDIHEAVSPVWPTSGVRERSPEVDRLIRTGIMKSPDSTNWAMNYTIHIPALRNFNAGMCGFCFQ
jgi:hypothetical protein